MNAWYALRIFSNHLKLLGPLSLTDLKEQLVSGKIAFSDFIYQPQDKRRWVRAFEIPELLSALPEEPSENEFLKFEDQIGAFSVRPPLPPKAPVVADDAIKYLENYGTDWSLQSEGTEYGPFTFREVEKILRTAEFPGAVLLWHDRLHNWLKVNSFTEFLESLEHAIESSDQLVIEKGVNTRASRRRLLVASVMIRLKHMTAVGICWDISEGGLQAYRLDAELSRGTTYSMSIVPAISSGVPPFTVHAKLLWANEQTEKMGFQFTDQTEIQTVTMNLKKVSSNISKY